MTPVRNIHPQIPWRSIFPYVLVFVFLFLFLAGGCGKFYGEPRDKSRFISAELMAGDVVLFSYAHTVYRMATGIAAFPDGGKARYDVDINILGTYNLDTHETRVLKREPNRDWQPDAGHYRILQVKGPTALVIQGGQLAGSSYKIDKTYWLLNIDGDSMDQLDLEQDLKVRGRAEGYMYMIRDDGTLLLICPSLEEKNRNPHWRRDPGVIPELWVRYPGGDYYRIAASRHYEGMERDKIIYWIPRTRRYMDFDLNTRETTGMKDYKHPPFQDVTGGVMVDNDGRHLLLGHKEGGNWRYVSIGLEPEQFIE